EELTARADRVLGADDCRFDLRLALTQRIPRHRRDLDLPAAEEPPQVLGRPRRIHYRWDGGGFEYDNSELFARYGPNHEDVHASHSICLQALGERGWIGIEIFMYIRAYTWSRCRRISRLADDSDDG